MGSEERLNLLLRVCKKKRVSLDALERITRGLEGEALLECFKNVDLLRGVPNCSGLFFDR